jgi:hypothetical protein
MDTTLMNTIRMGLYNRFVNERLLGLIYGMDYECIAKGDDTVAVYDDSVDLRKVQRAYFSVFFNKNDAKEEDWGKIHHGLGQIAKFYHWGTLEDIDFCSINVFYVPHYNCYKITRKLDRFLTLTAWSTKCRANLDTTISKIYSRVIAIANLSWMKDLPIFRTYNALFMKDVPYDISMPNIGKIKELLKDEFTFDVFKAIKIEGLEDLLSEDAKYGKLCFQSVVYNDEYVIEAYYDYLFRYFDMSRSEIHMMEKAILNYDENGIIHYSIEKLVKARQHRTLEEYLKRGCF